MVILYILLFIVFLSILIIIHELGHLAAAKIFKVYCLEYSIGMGPLLFKHKKEGGETQFSIRAIPFGGYVSMYGEGVKLPEGVEIDESRSLNGVKPWKRAIILLAGVFMNAILALFFFLITNCFPHVESDYINHVKVNETAETTLPSNCIVKFEEFEYKDTVANETRIFYLMDNQTTFDDNDTTKYATCFFLSNLNNTSDMDFSKHLYFYGLTETIVEGETRNVPDFTKNYPASSFNKATVHLTERITNEEGERADGDVHTVTITQKDGVIQPLGISIWYRKVQYNFGEVLGHTFIDFGRSSGAIFEALGNLIVKPSSWGQVGGIIAIGYETTAVLKTSGFINFLRIWGVISVNLAIFNLLPFPGLDGWQLLVLGIETTTKKKIPEKVKNIVSLVGIGLLLLLMGVIVIKDLVTYVFTGLHLLL